MRENDMTVMTTWDLFEDLRAMQDEVMRTNMGRTWRPGQQHDGPTSAAAWAPAVDISERKDAYLVAVELPGVKTDDLEITFEDGLLTIQGERHFAHDAVGEKVHRAERRYGAFRRSITLPSHVEADKIEASTQDGVLQVLVPKAQEVQAKRIQVRAGQGPVALTVGAEAKNGD
jgi:HSP20 family protein